MRKILILIPILALLAAACVPDGYYSMNPDLAVEDARATLRVATALAVSTQQAHLRAAATATVSAARTKQVSDAEIALLNAQIQGTQQAVAAVQTVSAGTAQARAASLTETAQAAATGTAWPQTATPLAATMSAVARQAQHDQAQAVRREQIDAAWSAVWPSLLIILAIVLAFIAITSINELKKWFIEWRDRNRSILETRQGLVVYVYDPAAGGGTWQMLSQRPQLRARNLAESTQVDPVRSITLSGSVLESPIHRSQPNGTRAQALQLLHEAIARSDENSNKIPGWRELGWSSDRWQRVIAALDAQGLIVVERGVGTFVAGEADLGDVLYKLETGQVRLRPTPAAWIEER